MENLKIRNAERKDIDFVAYCNYSATSPYPGFSYWDPLIEGFGIETMEFIKQGILIDAFAWCKINDFVIVELDGDPAGGASRFVMSKEDYRPIDLTKLEELARNLNLTGEQLRLLIERYNQVWGNPHDETLSPLGEWIIECVAVKEEFRGKGVATFLMEFIKKESKEKNMKSIGVSVTQGNLPAEKLYYKSGFKPMVTYHTDFFEGQYPGTLKFRWR